MKPDQFCKCGRPVIAVKAMVLCECGVHPAFCACRTVDEALTRLLYDVRGER